MGTQEWVAWNKPEKSVTRHETDAGGLRKKVLYLC
jgi:hypothetical protein